MRILVIIIAILALLAGLAYLVGGALSVISGVLMMTTGFTPEIEQASEMSPRAIGLVFFIIALLMTVNGLIFVFFAVGTFIRRGWARYLGIFGYALNIVVLLITALTTKMEGSSIHYVFGTFVAIAFIIVLVFAKRAFQNPTTNAVAKGV